MSEQRFHPRQPPMGDSEFERFVERDLAQHGLRRGRRFVAGQGLVEGATGQVLHEIRQQVEALAVDTRSSLDELAQRRTASIAASVRRGPVERQLDHALDVITKMIGARR